MEARESRRPGFRRSDLDQYNSSCVQNAADYKRKAIIEIIAGMCKAKEYARAIDLASEFSSKIPIVALHSSSISHSIKIKGATFSEIALSASESGNFSEAFTCVARSEESMLKTLIKVAAKQAATRSPQELHQSYLGWQAHSHPGRGLVYFSLGTIIGFKPTDQSNTAIANLLSLEQDFGVQEHERDSQKKLKAPRR